MSDPKLFYRKLDSFLAKIGKGSSDKNFLSSIFKELIQNFGSDLQLIDGCIYEQRDQSFSQIFSLQKNQWASIIPIDSPSIQLVLSHGSFIYDDPDLKVSFAASKDSVPLVPAAITVSSPERQWLFVFGLQNDWRRDEVTLFLNSVKTDFELSSFFTGD